jgi:hypothetical protein
MYGDADGEGTAFSFTVTTLVALIIAFTSRCLRRRAQRMSTTRRFTTGYEALC